MTMNLFRVIASAALFVLTLAGAPLPYTAGVATTDITPEKAMWMAGYAARKLQSDGVAQKLHAKALVLEDEAGHRVVLLTADVLGLTSKVSARIADGVRQRYGIRRENLLLNSSHTHSGPVIDDMLSVAYDLSPRQWKDIEGYTAELEAKIVNVIGAAMERMRPAQLRFGHGTATFAANRRIQFNPAGPVDHDVPVLRVDDVSGNAIAVVFGYACHNTTLGAEQSGFHGDYAGYAQAALEEAHTGATALFLTGCGADANPRPRGTQELAREHGQSLARSVEQAFDSLKPVSGPLRTAFGVVQLKFAAPPSKDELVKRLDEPNEFVRRHARLLLRKLAREGELDAAYPDPVQVWRFGSDLALIAMGGEVVVDYALRLKREYGTAGLWAMGYSNDVFGYVPSLRVLKEGGYEGGGAMMYYGQTGAFDDSVEEAIFSKVKELMTKTN